MEAGYKRGDARCELLIAGFLYIIDFEHMFQYRRNDPSRRRKIKRDLASTPKKGIAGLRIGQDVDPGGGAGGAAGDGTEAGAGVVAGGVLDIAAEQLLNENSEETRGATADDSEIGTAEVDLSAAMGQISLHSQSSRSEEP